MLNNLTNDTASKNYRQVPAEIGKNNNNNTAKYIQYDLKTVAQPRGCFGCLEPYLWKFLSITIEKKFNLF